MTIEDPPWKKKTRPCPFYSQGRCLFSDACNFMHTVKIRRPDSIVGSEDSDQMDFRLVVESPASSKSVRLRSPNRSPRTTSLLLALGDIIQQDEEEGEWEEEESGEQESSSVEESSEEGHAGGEYAHASLETPPRDSVNAEFDLPETHPDAASDNSARPTPILGLGDDARRLPSLREDSPRLPESSVGEGSATLVDGISTRSGSPSGDAAVVDEEVTVTRFRHSPTEIPTPSSRASINSDAQTSPSQSVVVSDYQLSSRRPSVIPDSRPTSRRASAVLDSPAPSRRTSFISEPQPPPDPPSTLPDIQPPSRPPSVVPELPSFSRRISIQTPRHASSHSRDSTSSGLLSPIEISGARRISFAGVGSSIERESSFDSGYAEDPEPLRRSPPRSPRRFSTLSILSSPFGSPSARVLGGARYNGFEPVVPSASAFFSPRFGSFPTSLTQEGQDDERSAMGSRHSRDDSVDSMHFTQESNAGSQFEDAITGEEVDIHIRPSSTTDASEDSSLFRNTMSSGYLGVDDDDFRVGEASFGSDDSMTSLYDQYYTPTIHTAPMGTTSTQPPSFLNVNETSVYEPPLVELSYAQDDSFEDDVYGQDSSPMDLSYLQDTSPRTVVPAHESLPQSLGSAEASSSVLPSTSPVDPSSSLLRSEVSSPVPPVGANVPSSLPAKNVQDHPPMLDDISQEASSSSPAVRPASSASSSSEARGVFSPIEAHLESAISSGQTWNFSLPSSVHDSVVFAAPSQSASPSSSTLNENGAEGSARSGSSLSYRGGEIISRRQSIQSSQSSQSESRRIPFGFRHAVSDSSQLSVRRSQSVQGRARPSLLVAVDRAESEPQSQVTTPLSPVEEAPLTGSPPVSNPRHLKPLRLSMILSSSSGYLDSSVPSSSIPSLTTATTATTVYESSPTVSSIYSLSNNRLLSSPRSSTIPSHFRNTTGSSQPNSPLHIRPIIASPPSQPTSAPPSRPPSWQHRFSRKSLLQQPSRRYSSSLEQHQQQHSRSESRLSEPIDSFDERCEDEYYEYEAADQADETIRRPVSATSSRPHDSIFASQQKRQSVSTNHSHRESLIVEPVHAIATPRPTLLFALASDNVEEVRRVLDSGEARPNDDIGPQSALAFTLANGQLKNKMQMVKMLLAYGADTSVLRDQEAEACEERSSRRGSGQLSKLLENVDPATRYYIERADSPQTRRASALIHRSYFRPLTKVRYTLVGQDRVLEQLFRVLSMPSMAPIVVLLCGPSGHGKSLLARTFGTLLEVPAHTVNMTTLQNTRDIWKSHSIAPHEDSSDKSLKDFLIENEGKRCVVVLDEIEKTQDEKILSSLLMPWEYGRCSFEAGYRHVDVSKVIWLGTSNIGHDLVFEHQNSRPAPEMQLSREDYVDLMGLLRPRVSERLGPSLLSRVTAVLPFVAFTTDEKMAIAAEALHTLAGDMGSDMPPATRDQIVRTSLNSYIPAEGARSLYRAVSTLLLDTI